MNKQGGLGLASMTPEELWEHVADIAENAKTEIEQAKAAKTALKESPEAIARRASEYQARLKDNDRRVLEIAREHVQKYSFVRRREIDFVTPVRLSRLLATFWKLGLLEKVEGGKSKINARTTIMRSDEEALAIAKRHDRLVFSIFNKKFPKSRMGQDLIEAGRRGAFEAARRYDESKGFSPSTYLGSYIFGYILREIQKQAKRREVSLESQKGFGTLGETLGAEDPGFEPRSELTEETRPIIEKLLALHRQKKLKEEHILTLLLHDSHGLSLDKTSELIATELGKAKVSREAIRLMSNRVKRTLGLRPRT